MIFIDKIFYSKYYHVLLSAIIPLLVLGPFFPDLIISISAILFLIFVFIKQKFDLILNKFSIYFYIFYVICIISSLISSDILFSLKSSLPYVRLIIFCHLVSYLLQQNNKILEYFYISCSITFIILCNNALIEYFFGHNIFFQNLHVTGRISSFFYEEKILGSYLSRLFPLYIALALVQKKNFIFNFVSMFVTILILISIIISGERAATYFLILSFFFMMVFFNNFKKIKILFLLVFTLIFIIFFSNFFETTKPLRDRLFIGPYEEIFSNKEKVLLFTAKHDSHMRTALKAFVDKPLLGHGPRSFRKICQIKFYQVGDFPCNTHPHNFYIQLLSETGLVGFSFLFYLLVFFCFKSIKYLLVKYFSKKPYIEYTNFQLSLLSSVLITIFPITTNGNFFTNNLMILYFFPLGFLFYSYAKKKRIKLINLQLIFNILLINLKN